MRNEKREEQAKGETETAEMRQQIQRLTETLERERAEYRALTESLPQMVWSTDRDGNVTYMSRRWSDFTGTPDEKLLGAGWLGDLHPDDRERVAATWQSANQSRKLYEAEYRIRGRNGGSRRFLARGVPVYDAQGQLSQYVGTTTDITEQVADRERDRLLQKIADSIRFRQNPQEVLATITAELGWFVQAARVYYADVDESKQTIAIHSDFRRDARFPPLPATLPLRAKHGVLQACRAGRTLAFYDLEKDPRTAEFYAEMFAPYGICSLLSIPLHENGQWTSTLLLADDAPRHWSREEEELARAVAERTRLALENARLYEAEREKTKRLEESFAETHHRVKNNLQVIAALLDLRVMDDDEDNPVTREDLQRMVGNVRAIAAVHDFLAHQAAMTVSAREVVRRLAPMVAQTAHVTATWEADDAILSVQQGTALALILNEAISNSGKHGGANATVTLRNADGEMLLEIGDDGPGFPPDFDPERASHQGLELIMSLARRDLQGDIAFVNGENGGGCVRIRFRSAA